MFDGIFWDDDGVLMETEHLYYQANAEALAQAGVELFNSWPFSPLAVPLAPGSLPVPDKEPTR